MKPKIHAGSPVHSSAKNEGFRGSGEQLEDEMLQAVGRYLDAKGWNVLVIGADRIQSALRPDRKFNYEFVIRFTGSSKEATR